MYPPTTDGGTSNKLGQWTQPQLGQRRREQRGQVCSSVSEKLETVCGNTGFKCWFHPVQTVKTCEMTRIPCKTLAWESSQQQHFMKIIPLFNQTFFVVNLFKRPCSKYVSPCFLMRKAASYFWDRLHGLC